MRHSFLALCASLLFTLACAQAEPRVARASAATATAPDQPRTSSSVVLRSNDVFELRMSGMPQEDASQFAGQQTIDGSGQVNILYIGRIQASGRTPGELEKAIEQALIDKKIFRWPTATVNVATSLRYVVIGGNVRNPNRMPWSADLSLMSAIMSSAGPGDFAGDKINLVRAGKITVYSYKKLRKEPSEDPKLLPGDQVELL